MIHKQQKEVEGTGTMLLNWLLIGYVGFQIVAIVVMFPLYLIAVVLGWMARFHL